MTSFLKYIGKHALRFLEKIGKRKSSLDESIDFDKDDEEPIENTEGQAKSKFGEIMEIMKNRKFRKLKKISHSYSPKRDCREPTNENIRSRFEDAQKRVDVLQSFINYKRRKNYSLDKNGVQSDLPYITLKSSETHVFVKENNKRLHYHIKNRHLKYSNQPICICQNTISPVSEVDNQICNDFSHSEKLSRNTSLLQITNSQTPINQMKLENKHTPLSHYFNSQNSKLKDLCREMPKSSKFDKDRIKQAYCSLINEITRK